MRSLLFLGLHHAHACWLDGRLASVRIVVLIVLIIFNVLFILNLLIVLVVLIILISARLRIAGSVTNTLAFGPSLCTAADRRLGSTLSCL